MGSSAVGRTARSWAYGNRFWQPGGHRVFTTLSPGEPFLFKLHYPDDAIVGGGFFTHASRVPASVAWEAFGEKNGAGSYEEMCRRIESYRRAPLDYPLSGNRIWLPGQAADQPGREFLEWHADTVYRG